MKWMQQTTAQKHTYAILYKKMFGMRHARSLATRHKQFNIRHVRCKLKFSNSHIKVAFGKFMVCFRRMHENNAIKWIPHCCARYDVVRSLAAIYACFFFARVRCARICILGFCFCISRFVCLALFAAAADVAALTLSLLLLSFLLLCRLSSVIHLLLW